MSELISIISQALAERIVFAEFNKLGVEVTPSTAEAIKRAVERFAPQCMDDAATAITAIEQAGYRLVKKTDFHRAQQGLDFGAMRLEHTYGENPNVDFLLSMRSASAALAASKGDK